MGLNTQSRTKNASINAISAVSMKIFLLLLTLISRKIFIKYIGLEYLGINGLFSNILTLLSMADMGIGTAMNVSLYRPIANNDEQRIAALIGYFRKLYLFIAAGVTIIGLLILPFLNVIVNIEKEIPHISLIYLIFVFKNTASYLYVYKSAVIRADQKSYIVNRVNVIANALKVVVQLISVVVFENYFIYIIIDLISVLANNIVLSAIADKKYAFINKKVDLPDGEKKSIFGEITSVFLYKISWGLLNGVENIVMSIVVGTIAVGLYSNYVTLTMNIESLIGLLFTSLTASVGNLVVTSTSEKRYQIFKTMQMFSFWLCAIVVIGLVFLLQDFIQLWLGKEMQLDNITVVAIILKLFLSLCMRPVWTFREGTGMYRQIKYIMLVTAILNLLLSILLGNWLGMCGIIFASSIAKVCTYFWYEPKILFENFFNVSCKKYYFEYLKNVGLLMISGFLCYFPFKFLSDISWITWCLKGILCVCVVTVVYFVRYYKTAELEFFIDKLKTIRR